ncbi:putative polysaccharide biosynthesis protein [Aquibacillus rhizosphaerae]|uniref:Polysaccharide biosynthesis protein n=1 Tax=Aquibacillus rhizosphaerae TaxID=3051431 RepID=A0ABT7L0S5_9BACI|nr:polysaccharide biosynthesis protein [Aquibacillus sp. LR5S19]MDL4839400.1 polysaccharide biosynthesis protein [Aquibacillus sp. LR5S19]
MATSNILRGTLLLTAATFLSKLLGMIYVIPFNELVGETGGALFYYAYNPYNILLSISTVGVPLAVSKFVSKYNALGDYQTGRRMFKSGLIVMAATGFIAFLVLYLSAELLALRIIAKEDSTSGNSVEDITMVIRMVSFALIIVPAMSIVRGFFQGYESMGPTAISQVVEQIVRIVFLLVAAFLVVNVFQGTIATAVGWATFAAFIGAIASCIVLFIFWKKRKSYLDIQLQQQATTYDIPTKDLFKELFQYAGPFVLVGIATPLYQQIDTLTFNRAMDDIGQGGISEFALGSMNFYSHKLVIIPVTLAIGLSLATLPALTRSFAEKKRTLMYQQINQSFQIVMLFVLPAVIGLSLLSNEAYGSLFGLKNIDITSSLLAWYAPVALFFALFTVSSSVLQGIEQQRFAVVSLTAGILLKILLNVPLIHTFGAKGAIFGTFIAVSTAVALNIWRIKNAVNYRLRELTKRTMLIVIFTTIMGITVWLTKWLLSFYITYLDGRMEAFIILVVSVFIGTAVYLWLSYVSTLLERILGDRVRIFDKVFKRN